MEFDYRIPFIPLSPLAVLTPKGWFQIRRLKHGRKGRVRMKRLRYLDRQELTITPGSEAFIENLSIPDGM